MGARAKSGGVRELTDEERGGVGQERREEIAACGMGRCKGEGDVMKRITRRQEEKDYARKRCKRGTRSREEGIRNAF